MRLVQNMPFCRLYLASHVMVWPLNSLRHCLLTINQSDQIKAKTVAKLIKRGWDPLLRDNEGMTPADYAKMCYPAPVDVELARCEEVQLFLDALVIYGKRLESMMGMDAMEFTETVEVSEFALAEEVLFSLLKKG